MPTFNIEVTYKDREFKAGGQLVAQVTQEKIPAPNWYAYVVGQPSPHGGYETEDEAYNKCVKELGLKAS